jgi:site-specific recombinase XerD
VIGELEHFRQVGDGLVFSRSGNPYAPFTTRDVWHEALVTAGLTPWKPGMREDQGFRFHDLRHSTASFLAARGASLLAIGEVLGRRSTQTTKRYSHLVTSAKQRLTDEVFGELLAATRSAS